MPTRKPQKKSYSSEEMDRYFNDPSYRRSRSGNGQGFFRRHLTFLLITLVIVLGLTTWYGMYVVSGLPSLEQLENPKPALSTKIYSVDGEVVDQFYIEQRSRASLDKLPPGLVQALIATEDKQFYDHWGVNLPRFVRQMAINLITFRTAGASTITQQLSRNLYKLTSQNESLFDKITRKIREFITSVQIERNFTKREILELYLSVSYLGHGAYGIESAARYYFDKPAADLTPPEYTMLMGMYKGPSYFDPLSNLDRVLKRRNIVINAMVEDGHISPTDAEKIKSDTLTFRMSDGESHTGISPHFIEWVRQQLLKKAEKYGFDVYRDGLRVYTTLNSKMQRYANKAVEEHLTEFQQQWDPKWDWKKNPDILRDNVMRMIKDTEVYKKSRNAAARDSLIHFLRNDPAFLDSVKKAAKTIEVGFVAINPHTGEILAMVGGRNFREFRYGLNHVTQIRRQPGSAFKPFVYTVALDNGYPVSMEIYNQPVTMMLPDGTRWTPQNFDGNFGGKYTLREALKFSINLVAVRMILDIAPVTQVVEYAKRMGITSPIPPYPSIALGTPEISPLELTTAYGVFANEGVFVQPYGIFKIEDKDGNLIEQSTPERREVLSKQTAYLITNLLEGAVNEGTGRAVRRFFALPAAGKTGTTNDYADAWFVGFTPQIAAGTWVGFDDNRIRFGGADGQGGRAAAPIFGKFMQYVYEDPQIGMPLEYFQQPEGIVTDTICVDTKKKAREWCPNTMTEIFNAKYPIGLCDLHTSANWNEGKESPSKISW